MPIQFSGLQGRGDAGTSLVLSITWTLGAEAVSREVTINGTPFASLGALIPYSDMDAGDAQVDRIVSGILRVVMTAIESPSGGR